MSHAIRSTSKLHRCSTVTRYNEKNKQWNTFNGYVQPLMYLVPESAQDIQKAILCGKLSDTRVVAKSGGHSYVKNSFGDSNSMVIDLQNFNDISLDAGKMTCEIGSGQRVGMISEILCEKGNYLVAVGICPTVGIGGFTLGGGYGYFTRQFGISSDNLVEAEMVDARGELLIVNDQTDKDLFWAIRGGGGGNFGIVTKFKFKMHDAPESVVYGRYCYTIDTFFQFFNSWQSLITSDLNNNIGTQIFISKERIRMEIFAFNFPNNIYSETLSTIDIEDLLRSFVFPTQSESFIEMNWYGEFIKNTSEFYYEAENFEGWKKLKSIYVAKVLDKNEVAKLEVMLSSYLLYSDLYLIQDGGAIDNFSRTDTAFVHRNFLYNIQLQSFNKNSSESNLKANAGMITFYEDSKKLLNHKESYQNFLDPDITDYLERYYQENFERLIQVKKRVDPENIFHYPQSIPTSYK